MDRTILPDFMTPRARDWLRASVDFERQMRALEDWYADSTRAQAYDVGSGPVDGSASGGHQVLHVAPYPGPNWRREFRLAARADDLTRAAAINRALEDELYGLDHAPSQSGPASGLHRGTLEWRRAVAEADGSLRAVARRFGISHSEVRRLRLASPGNPTAGRRRPQMVGESERA